MAAYIMPALQHNQKASNRTPGPAQAPSAPPKSAASPSGADHLSVTTQAATAAAASQVVACAASPTEALKALVEAKLAPFSDPGATYQKAVERIQADPVKGSLQAVGTVAGMAGTGLAVAVGAAGVAAVALPEALGAAVVYEGAVIAADAFGALNLPNLTGAAGLALHAARGTTATTAEEETAEGKAAGGDLQKLGFRKAVGVARSAVLSTMGLPPELNRAVGGMIGQVGCVPPKP